MNKHRSFPGDILNDENDLTHSELHVQNVSKSFGQLHTLNKVELSVGAGEFVSIVGPSGCGKSTLLEIVAGLTLPDDGQVLLNGRDKTGQQGHAAYMPQQDVLLPWRTIIDNVIVALEIAGVDKKEARKEAEQWLPVFGLDGFRASYPHELSGGMRQRAAFLRTCLGRKRLMLLDEPFGSLDALTRLDMQRWLLEMWQQFRTSVLLVTHDIDEAIYLSDRIYVFTGRPGSVAGEFTVGFERPRNSDITTSDAFLQLKSNILQRLRQE